MCRHLGRYFKSILIPALSWFFAAVANAQFQDVRAASIEAPGQKTPVIADIILQTTSITPWGTYTQVLKGKFWRSRDGKSRQDDSFGTSLLRSSTTDTWVERELQTAMVTPSNRPLFTSLSSFAVRPKVRKGMIDGGAVFEWSRSEAGSRDFHFDTWNDIRLGIPILLLQKIGATETIQQLTNIEEREPDPELFKIPEGFSAPKCKPTASTDRPQPSNRPVRCGADR
jgi:hypothetical protein